MGRRRQRAGKKGIYHKNKNFKISRGRKQKWEEGVRGLEKRVYIIKIKTLKYVWVNNKWEEGVRGLEKRVYIIKIKTLK
jgi:hypothetical protein